MREGGVGREDSFQEVGEGRGRLAAPGCGPALWARQGRRLGALGRAEPSPPSSLSLARNAKSSLPTWQPQPLPGLPSQHLPPHLLIIQFQVQIAQTGLGDYFFMVTKHKRTQHPFSVYFHSPRALGGSDHLLSFCPVGSSLARERSRGPEWAPRPQAAVAWCCKLQG